MIRALIGLLVAAIAAAFIRAVVGMITKEVTNMVNPEQAPRPTPPPPAAAPGGPTATALKKCPVCGTYSPSERLVAGQYCSPECAQKAS